MSFKLVFLWTDILLFLLLFLLVIYALYISRYEHLRAPWHDVFKNRIATAAAFVLVCYLAVGLCDSVHMHIPAKDQHGVELKNKDGSYIYDSEVVSLFDLAVMGLKNNSESTYSEPLALYSYTKKNIRLKNGQKVRAYSRLKYAGAGINSTSERNADILHKAILGGLYPTLIALVVYILISLKVHSLPSRPNKQTLPIFVFLFGIIFSLGAAFSVSEGYHLFGTDKVGLDVFYRALKGIRTGIVIGTLTSLIMVPFAIIMGTMAGYFKGVVDDIIQYVYITISSVPGILLIASAIKILQVYMELNPDRFGDMTIRSDTQLFLLCMILGVTSWTGLCRILRGETLKLRELEYIQASRALGVRHIKIIFRHIVPNIMHIVLITVVLNFSGLVLAEAVLSYVGVGVDPSMESWGNMINAARLELTRDPVVWWSLVAAFVLMFGLVLAANLFADGVRDAFDPRTRKLVA